MAEIEEATPAETDALSFRAEIKQLLNILAHSLYTDREIFLRELLSNASDALNRLHFEQLTNHAVLDPDAELAIRIESDEKEHILRVSDTGIGMTREEFIENLGTIAHSGAMSFLSKLQTEGKPGNDIIGQFGVGFYSVFMVAEEVKVTSRSYQPDAQAMEWISRGENTYSLKPAHKESRGTLIEIKLKEDAHDFASRWRIEQIVRKHSNFIAFPIYVGEKTDNQQPVNQQTAIWRQHAKELTAEQYTDFYKQLTFDSEPPLAHIHLIADAPVQLYALLYIPRHREQTMFRRREEEGLQLYSRKVLIQDYCTDLLPKHFRFVHGVVDCEDLPLNVSRETVQSNPVMAKLKQTLSRRIQQELERLAEKEPENYKLFWEAFSSVLKEGLATDPTSHESLAKLLRYPSSYTEGDALTALKDYVERMKPDQKEIYYILGDDRNTVAQSPHLDPFKARNLEVLYLVEPIDSFVMVTLREFEGKKFRNIDDAGLELPATGEKKPEEIIPTEEFDTLLARIREVLGDRVIEVREGRSLTSNPARLVSPQNAVDRDMQRVRRFLDQKYELPKKILEVNRHHRLLENLARLVKETPTSPTITITIEQLYENGLLQEGLHPNPIEMVGRIQQLMEAATSHSDKGKNGMNQ